MKRLHNFDLPRNRLMSTLMSGHSSTVNEGQPFALKSSTEFASRSNQIFESLSSLETKHESKTPKSEKEESRKEVFKKPRTLAPRRIGSRRSRQTLPGYVVSPEKWRKYSLADVPEHTEESNTSIAMDFLSSVKKRKSAESTQSSRKPSGKSQPSTSSNGKMVMPECVVGFRHAKTRKTDKTEKKRDKTEINLSHLTNMDDV